MNHLFLGSSSLAIISALVFWAVDKPTPAPFKAKPDVDVAAKSREVAAPTTSFNEITFAPATGDLPIIQQLSQFCLNPNDDRRIRAGQKFLRKLDATKLREMSEEVISATLAAPDKEVLNWVIGRWSELAPDQVMTFLMERYPDGLPHFIQDNPSFAVQQFRKETGWRPLEAAWFHPDELTGFWQTSLRDFLAAETTLPDEESQVAKIQARATAELETFRSNRFSQSPEVAAAAVSDGNKLATNLSYSEITPEIYRSLVRFVSQPTPITDHQPQQMILADQFCPPALSEAIAQGLSRLWPKSREEIIQQFKEIPQGAERDAAIRAIAKSNGCTLFMAEAKLTLLHTFISDWQKSPVTPQLISLLPFENPPALAHWLEMIPPGEVLDQCKFNLANNKLDTVPAEAMALVLETTPGVPRTNKLKELFGSWHSRDAATASAWLDNAATDIAEAIAND